MDAENDVVSRRKSMSFIRSHAARPGNKLTQRYLVIVLSNVIPAGTQPEYEYLYTIRADSLTKHHVEGGLHIPPDRIPPLTNSVISSNRGQYS